MKLESVLVLTACIAIIVYLLNEQYKAPNEHPTSIFLNQLVYGRDQRGVCYAIAPNYGYGFTSIPCEIQK